MDIRNQHLLCKQIDGIMSSSITFHSMKKLGLFTVDILGPFSGHFWVFGRGTNKRYLKMECEKCWLWMLQKGNFRKMMGKMTPISNWCVEKLKRQLVKFWGPDFAAYILDHMTICCHNNALAGEQDDKKKILIHQNKCGKITGCLITDSEPQSSVTTSC